MLPDGFLGFINEHRLFTTTSRVLLAVSGGIDSVVLMDLMHQNGYLFGVAHVNFGLRGPESDADAVFVENRARTYGVPFYQARFDTAAEANRRGESTQVTARQLRYEWFAALQSEHGYVAVATAHHLNDVLETMLLNLTRGTGLAGLRGMPIRSGTFGCNVVRPLWMTTRADIDNYARTQQLTWRDDASNATDAYSRNRIRHWVVPELEQINLGLMQSLPRTLNQLRATEAILQADLAASFSQCVQHTPDGLVIDVGTLASFPEPQFRLGEWVRTYGFTPDVLAQCWQAIDPASDVPDRNGQTFLAPAHRLVHDRGKLWLMPLHPIQHPPITVTNWPAVPLNLGSGRELCVQSMAKSDWDGQYPTDPDIALFDADMIPFPWTLRHWKTGDRIGPLGMAGTRPVRDLLADARLPPPQRERTWILEANEQIFWVVGVRIAQYARLTAKTNQVAQLHWREVKPVNSQIE